LTTNEKKDVERQEVRFQQAKEQARERKAERQMGEHGAQIPQVKTTSSSSEPKRKRDDDGSASLNVPKAPRTTSGENTVKVPSSTGVGRPNMASQPTVVHKKKAPFSVFMKKK
jgi:hypothetical protein